MNKFKLILAGSDGVLSALRTVGWSKIGLQSVHEYKSHKSALTAALNAGSTVVIAEAAVLAEGDLMLFGELKKRAFDGVTVAVSFSRDFNAAVAAIACGVKAFIALPADEDEILKTVQAALEEHGRATQDTHDASAPPAFRARRYKAVVTEALNLIGRHYSEKITVKWAANELFVSESHLMHEFATELGKTFNECLREYRLTKAKELLVAGNMRVNEIASAVGFTDAKYFARVFKAATGKTPREFYYENKLY